MHEPQEPTVVGPMGDRIGLSSLPPPQTRWVARRKAEVVAAIQGGLIGFDDVCARYDISAEELASWQTAVRRGGMAALQVTRLSRHRRKWAQER